LIDVQQRGEGWIATLDGLDYEIDDVDPSRRPMFNLLPDRDQWAYRTRASAVLAVVMHALFSLMPVGRKHWSEIYLDGKDEIALLVPVTKKKEVGTVVAILSGVPVKNWKSANIVAQYCDDKGNLSQSFVLSKWA
jgi:hypothetical protein